MPNSRGHLSLAIQQVFTIFIDRYTFFRVFSVASKYLLLAFPEPLPLEHDALCTSEAILEHHDEDDEVEEVLLEGEEDKQIHHRAIDEEPHHQHNEVDSEIRFSDRGARELIACSGAPAHVVVVTDEVDLHKVEEGVVLEQIHGKAEEEFKR